MGSREGVYKILIVDDRPENLIALEALIEKEDREIIQANSGEEALKLVMRNDFSLVLLDVRMPDMDGFEVAELMRANKSNAKIPILFVTAINREDRNKFKGYEEGPVDYLMKPMDPDVVIEKVDSFLYLNA